MRYYIISLLSAIFVAAVSTGCSDELPVSYDYTVAGQEVTVTVPVSLPKMEVKSRADLDNPGLNRVNSLWVAVYSAGGNGEMTSEGWTKLTPGTTDTEVPHEVTLKAKSGPSFIVAVANVDNMGVTRNSDGGPSEEQPLSTLLEAADTWEKFLAIAVVTPHLQQNVNAPTPPLPMVGAYTNLPVEAHSRDLSQWATENFQSYTIPVSTNGTVKLENGAIHMRRTVSQIKFNIKAGNDKIKVTPHSYRIVNVPVYSWLYERGKDGGSRLANFGDACTNDPDNAAYKEKYYVSPHAYEQSYITNNVNAQGKVEYTFSFWQGENKHTAVKTPPVYADRDLQYKGAPDDKGITENNGLFMYLVGGSYESHFWTPNNMASYVIINCTVDYDGEIEVNDQGQQRPTDDTSTDYSPVHRTAVANYMVHFGYIGNDLTDFNCYRNVKYTYNITINGVNDIRVEAFTEGDNPETPDVEGTVTDITNASVLLDSHYHAYNIELSEADLQPWSEEAGVTKGFGFLITTYDNLNGGEKTYSEDILKRVGISTFDNIPTDEKKYLDWVEFRPTTDMNTLAKYKPRGKEDEDGHSRTFNLVDAAKGIPIYQKIPEGESLPSEGETIPEDRKYYFTVFVNEYTYECPNANERTDANGGKTVWHAYVGADPRRYYIKVTRTTSKDGESIYVRSKYAGTQRSILSYYNPALTTEPEPEAAKQVKGSAIGVEHENEMFGINLRKSFISSQNSQNGRINAYNFSTYVFEPGANGSFGRWKPQNTLGSWDYFVRENTPLDIPEFNIPNFGTFNPKIGELNLPALVPFRDVLRDNHKNNPSGEFLLNAKTQYDPQPNSDDPNLYIEAINACMNRNRDNNGDGIIDKSEIRWYVPAAGKYLRLILGANALNPDPLVKYDEITRMPQNNNALDGPFLYFTSEGRVLWAMESMSTSNWCEWRNISPVAPWQVRCIRNLGTNLADVLPDDQTIPAYTYDFSGKYKKIFPTYYNTSSLRVNVYEGNGTDEGQMPVHSLANARYNSLYRNGFEIYSTEPLGHITYQDKPASTNSWRSLIPFIQSSDNYCNKLNEESDKNGGGWRLPNLCELAIMRNLALIKYANTLSCTMGAFDSQGVKVEPDTDTGSQHYFMSAILTNITQGAPDEVAEPDYTYYFLCVRDLR